ASYTSVNPFTCADVSLPATNCQEVNGGLDIGSPLTGAAVGAPDPTYNQSGTPAGIGGGLDGVPDVQNVQTANPTKAVEQQYNGRMDFQVTPSDLETHPAVVLLLDSFRWICRLN